MYCHQCSTDIQDHAQFCSACGTAQEHCDHLRDPPRLRPGGWIIEHLFQKNGGSLFIPIHVQQVVNRDQETLIARSGRCEHRRQPLVDHVLLIFPAN